MQKNIRIYFLGIDRQSQCTYVGCDAKGQNENQTFETLQPQKILLPLLYAEVPAARHNVRVGFDEYEHCVKSVFSADDGSGGSNSS